MSDAGTAQPQLATEPTSFSTEECRKLRQSGALGRASAETEPADAGSRLTQPTNVTGPASGPANEPAIEGAATRGVGVERVSPTLSELGELSANSGDSLKEQPKLAVADWSPFNSATAAQEASQSAANGTAEAARTAKLSQRNATQRRSQSHSSSEATESDSEKDAAEIYVSKVRHQSNGPAKSVPKKRRSPLPKSVYSPKKARRSPLGDRRRADDESDAIAALEQIKNAGSALPNKIAPATVSTGMIRSVLPQSALLDAAASRFPAGALEALARLVQQQPTPFPLQSPFQGRPASPPQAAATEPMSMGLMRTCVSETSADQLLAKAKQEKSALNTLQALVDTSNGKCGYDPAKQQAHFAPVKVRAASGPLPGGPPPYFPTVASDTATDTVFSLGSVLGHNTKPLASAFGQQGSAEAQQPSSAALALQKANLGAFGSIISNVVGSQLRKAVEVPTTEKGAPQEQNRHNSLPDQSGKPGGPAPVSTHGSGSGQAGRIPPAVPSTSAADAAAKVGALQAALPSTISGPDPRILDWVLGNRGSLTDRGKNSAAKASAAASTSGFEAFPRTGMSAAPKSETDLALAGQSLNPSTLRRPIARRATEMQEGLPGRPRSETMLETMLSQMHGSTPPMAPIDTAPVPTKLVDLASAAQHTLSAGDIGRVMQWAGTELALRDQKVREADKLREEERRAHDAAMNAVGIEVSRLKRGQAELAVTHWKLQEALSHKDGELREKCKLVHQLSTGITEITQQGIFAAKEAQSLRSDCDAMQSIMRSQDARILAEVDAVEEAMKIGNVGEAQALLSAWKRRLQQSSKEQHQPLPPTSRQ